MTRDQGKFIGLNKEKRGSVTFGNDVLAKISGKGIIKIRNDRTKEEYVSLVEDLKHNLLIVGYICD